MELKEIQERFLEFMRPPTAVPRYDILEFMAKDQQALDHGRLLPISPETIAKTKQRCQEPIRDLVPDAFDSPLP